MKKFLSILLIFLFLLPCFWMLFAGTFGEFMKEAGIPILTIICVGIPMLLAYEGIKKYFERKNKHKTK